MTKINPPAFFNSPKVRAEIAALHAKRKPPVSIVNAVSSRSDMHAFATQYPKSAELFGVVVTRWRASSARHPSENGHWAAYTHEEWCAWVGLRSSSALKVNLGRLERAGLIERALGKHGGNRVVSFIRPTPRGLHLSHHRPTDWKHLGVDPPTVGDLPITTVFKAAYQARTGTPLKAITKVEMAALKYIAKTLPEEGTSVLDRCVRSWTAFVMHVADAKGITLAKVSAQPSAELVRKNLQSACDFAVLQSNKTISQPMPTSPAPVQSVAPDEDKPATLEEIMAIMADDKPATLEEIMAINAEWNKGSD